MRKIGQPRYVTDSTFFLSFPFLSQLYGEPFPHALAKVEEEQRGRTQRQAQKGKHADAPAPPRGFEQLAGAKREYAADDAPEHRARGDGGGGVFLEGVDVVVLTRVEDGDLAQAEEDGRDEGDGEVHSVLDRPGEGEEGGGDEDGADVGERESVFRFGFYVVFPRELVVDGVDLGHEEPDGRQEAETGAQVHESDGGGVEAVELAVDGLEVGVERVRGAEEDGLVYGHGEDDGLREQDAQRSGH